MTLSLAGATILFDLDGTLVDTAPDLVSALNHVLVEASLQPVGMESVGTLIGHGARAMIERGMAVQGAALRPEEVDAHFKRFIDYYSDHIAERSRPFPGAVAALENLQAAGAQLAVCTNKSQILSDRLLEALDILRFFAKIVGADSVSSKKPHPAHIWETLDRCDGLAQRAIMVGDSRTDERAARLAGLPFIFFTFGYETETAAALRPDVVLSHYDELFAAISGLLN